MTDTNQSLLNGMSPRDERVLRMIIREELRSSIQECMRPCQDDLRALEQIVYGTDSKVGLKTRTTTLETKLANLDWWHRITMTAAVGAVITVIVSLIR